MFFLHKEQWLRPLRYLPSITRLQAYLNEHLRGFVDTQAIKSLPIREFLKDIGALASVASIACKKLPLIGLF